MVNSSEVLMGAPGTICVRCTHCKIVFDNEDPDTIIEALCLSGVSVIDEYSHVLGKNIRKQIGTPVDCFKKNLNGKCPDYKEKGIGF